MSWADVETKFKFYGPATDDLGHATGLDGTPATVNGWPAADYGRSFWPERREYNPFGIAIPVCAVPECSQRS